VFVILRQSPRTFVERVDFITSVGHGDGPGTRARLGLRGRGPTLVITDLGVLEPDPDTCELRLTALHPGADVAAVRAATGWPLAVAPAVDASVPPTDDELRVLRDLTARRSRKDG
jgi:glutaconate CoA-transferase subunit B